MIALLITMLLVPNLTDNISLLGALFFVYNVFTALQDVSTDALAVDVLQSHEFERVNSYMFTAKSLGGVIGGAGLGTIIGTVGIRGFPHPDSHSRCHHDGALVHARAAR